MKLITAICLLLAVCSVASARIGANLEECEVLYGKATAMGEETRNFKTGAILITCRFMDKKCQSVTYSLEGPSSVIHSARFGEDTQFSLVQSTRLLNLNGAGAAWEQQGKVSYGRAGDGLYKTADGKLQGLVNSAGVSIETLDYYAMRKTRNESAAVDKDLESLGASQVPALATKEFPPTADEQKMIDMQKQVDSLKPLK